jgi:hypothetical protein
MSARNSIQSYHHGIAAAGTSTSSLVASSLSSLADPPIRYIDAAAMDYFLIEMVHTLRASSSVALERTRSIEKEMIEAGLLPPVKPGKANAGGGMGTGAHTPTKSVKKQELRESASSGSLVLKTGVAAVEDPEEDALKLRLEAIGVHVGGNIAERSVLNTRAERTETLKLRDCRLCRDRPRFAETLDAVKFVCKEVWSTCWEKQVDNLRTNHRVCCLSLFQCECKAHYSFHKGVYVLQDNQFKPLSRISSYDGPQEALRRARAVRTASVQLSRDVR